MTSDFERSLHKWGSDRLDVKVAREKFLSTYRPDGSAEAVRRIDAIGTGIRNFFTSIKLPRTKFVYAKKRATMFPKLEVACTGWEIFPHLFLSTEGRLVKFSQRDSLSNNDYVYTQRLKEDEKFIGQYIGRPFSVIEYRPGVTDAKMIEMGPDERFTVLFRNEQEWASYYYGKSYDRSFDLSGPGQAMLVPTKSSELFLFTNTSDIDGWCGGVSSFDDTMRRYATEYVIEHRSGSKDDRNLGVISSTPGTDVSPTCRPPATRCNPEHAIS